MVAHRQEGSTIWTVEEYLALERYSTLKHEYHAGYVYAMGLIYEDSGL